MRFTIRVSQFFYALILFLIMFSFFSEARLGLPFVGYLDEILGLISVAFMIWYSFKHRLGDVDFPVIVMLIIAFLLGVLSNYLFKLIDKPFAVLIDADCLIKIIVPFLMYRHIGQYDKGKYTLGYLIPISKIMIISGFVCGTISLFRDIGMSGLKRYGIPAFHFIFINEGRYGYLIAAFLLIIVGYETNVKKINIYSIMAIVTMLYTTKGIIYIVALAYVVLILMWRKRAKFSTSNIAVLAAGGIAISSFQINTYLKNKRSARRILLRYGNKTAKEYFPFGSGFATYGSDQAAKNYSVLYKRYGFEEVYGMDSVNGYFLSDCYIGSILGQLGYFGLVLYIGMVFIMFKTINKICVNLHSKALAISVYVGLLVSTIGTGTIKSNIGVLLICIIGLLCGYSDQERAEENKKSQKLEPKTAAEIKELVNGGM